MHYFEMFLINAILPENYLNKYILSKPSINNIDTEKNKEK